MVKNSQICLSGKIFHTMHDITYLKFISVCYGPRYGLSWWCFIDTWICVLLLLGGVFYKCHLGPIGWFCSDTCYPYWFFWPVILSIAKSRMLKFATTIENLCSFKQKCPVVRCTHIEGHDVALVHSSSFSLWNVCLCLL